MSHSWLLLECHTYRHMSPLLTEELPDITEGCQSTLPSGEKTQSEPSIGPLTLPRTGEQTALRSPPFSSISLWLSSAVRLSGFLNTTFLCRLNGTRCHPAMFMTPKCHAWPMITRISTFRELIFVWFTYFTLCI